MPKFTQIKETCLYVKDLDVCELFYAEKLGLPIISKVEGRHIFFRAGTSVLLCFIAEATKQEEELPPHYGHGKLHMAFEATAEDYEVWKKTLQTKGIEIVHEHHWPRGHRSCYFHDPDGHVLEIVEEGMWH